MISLSIAICAGLVACADRVSDDGDDGDDGDDDTDNRTGMAEVVVDVARAAELNVTRVTVEVDGLSKEVAATPSSQVFEGVLRLSAGTHELVARAFIGTLELGRSSPTAVTIETDRPARASLSVVAAPELTMQLWQGPAMPCDVNWASEYTTCREPFAPQFASVLVLVLDWGGAEAGSLDGIADSCGGRFERDHSSDEVGTVWRWLPQPAGGLCLLTARATNAAGITAHLSMGVATPPGIAPPLPFLEGTLLRNYEIESQCPVVSMRETGCTERNYHAGDAMSLLVLEQRWDFRTPGSVEISDSCGSVITRNPDNDAFVWTQAGTTGATCHIRVQITAQDGTSSEARTSFQLR